MTNTDDSEVPKRRTQYYFEITALPLSEAPLEHRVALLGKAFPLRTRNMDGPQPEKAVEVESGALVDIADGVCTDLHQVVRALRTAGEGAAADYWAARNFAVLVFQRSEVRVFLPPQ